MFCAATDAEELYRCRTSYGGEFLISTYTCADDQVIYIHSAEVGFSPDSTYPSCPPLNVACTKLATNHSAIMNCHGQRYCRISQSILNYPYHDKLCENHMNGNFIKIKYDCVNPGMRSHVLVNVAYAVFVCSDCCFFNADAVLVSDGSEAHTSINCHLCSVSYASIRCNRSIGKCFSGLH